MKILTNEELLTKFIADKLSNFIEPQRKGTPKGEIIGFSFTKYKASLHMIPHAKMKEIAERLGISYGVLRKWNTEQEFKNMVKKNKEEFNLLLIEQKKREQLIMKALKKSSQQQLLKVQELLGGFQTDMKKFKTIFDKLKLEYEVNKSLISDTLKILKQPQITKKGLKTAIKYLSAALEK